MTTAHGSIRLNGVRKPHPFSASCRTGLVESAAQWQYQIADIEQAWFGHSFVYEFPSEGGPAICQDGRFANFDLRSGTSGGRNFASKLQRLYGLSLRTTEICDFSKLLASIESSLGASLLPITRFDTGYATGLHVYERMHSDHYVMAEGLDRARRIVHAMDTHFGRFELAFDDYERCLETFVAQGKPFTLSTCHWDRTVRPRPLDADTVRQDISAVVDNLKSQNPAEGLNALKAGINAMLFLLDNDVRPFVVPNMGRFYRERHSTARHMRHWSAIFPTAQSSLLELERIASESSGIWYRLSACMWSATVRGDPQLMRYCLPLSQRIATLEVRMAELFEELATSCQ